MAIHGRRIPRAERQAETNRMLVEAQRAPAGVRQELLDEVVIRNMPVARSVAQRYRDRGVPVEDLEQVAYLALVRAATRFDPDKADDFLTFAVPTVRGEIKRYFRDHGWTVRPTRRVQETQSLLLGAGVPTDGRGEALHDVGASLGIDRRDIDDALQAQGCFTPTSLDMPAHEDGEPMANTLVHEDFTDFDAVEARSVLRTLALEMTPRERLILYLRFFEERTQAEIGEEIGVTQMQVSRILTRVLDRMRKRLDPDHGDVA
jgi:RNA polymerase sigma-B factor